MRSRTSFVSTEPWVKQVPKAFIDASGAFISMRGRDIVHNALNIHIKNFFLPMWCRIQHLIRHN
ncbi:hypothetical protein NSPZN2_150011 [Nitrospira defluvii]|uniref:Uncharacterized protein n=1 Tax=Nitrospira defluvii TaxID=330214 RepID=A0ABM8RA57_9BACT|nr:hypothetical protein NSPZN2_150011 [Nitrospira defluvii]